MQILLFFSISIFHAKSFASVIAKFQLISVQGRPLPFPIVEVAATTVDY
jgi:hypothetical protein